MLKDQGQKCFICEGKGQIKHPIPQANKLMPWLCVGINIGELGWAKSQPRPKQRGLCGLPFKITEQEFGFFKTLVFVTLN